MKQAVEFHQRGLVTQAEVIYRRIISRSPDHFHALHFLGLLEAQRGRLGEAVDLMTRALKVNSKDASAHMNLGNALLTLKKYPQALKSFESALGIDPNYPKAHNGRGVCFLETQRPERALESFNRALAIDSHYPEAWNNAGNALQELNRYEEAITCYKRAVSIQPDFGDAYNNLGNALYGLRRYDQAIASYGAALKLDPDNHAALYNRGNALMIRGRVDLAVSDLTRLLIKDPDYDYIRGDVLHAKMLLCDWDEFPNEAASIEMQVRAGKRVCSPFAFQAISSSLEDLWSCANTFAQDKYPVSNNSLWKGEIFRHKRIRLGYVSGEFRAQATSYLMTGLFECHDKSKFELFAFDNGFGDQSLTRRRIENAFDHMIDISGVSDLEAARRIREKEIDILVNLNGYFGQERTGVFSRKPSPVQVNYLGFPGTMAHGCMDYIIADRFVIQEDEHAAYSEKVVYLPESYQANDEKRLIADQSISRIDAGLPENDFVFCCFNNSYKFNPGLFDIWMQILHKTGRSVLWLLHTSDAVVRNLRSEAIKRGIGPERLVFAPRMELDSHLARHRLADLFLDSLPYNAHTTASDALWGGLPVLTCVGATFPGRVGSSLLNSVGLPELVTSSLEDYEMLAVKLATDSVWLADIKARLTRNRVTHPLFDTGRFRQHIESAYIKMWERYQRGELPMSFSVPRITQNQ